MKLCSLNKTAAFTPTTTISSPLSHAQCSTSTTSINITSTKNKNTRIIINNAIQTSSYVNHKYSSHDWNSFLDPIRSPFITLPSTGAHLRNHWQEYQGLHDWAGLLDPLNETLRNEILRYGYFVEAAYRSFDFNPSSPSYGSSLFRRKNLLNQSGFPDTGYQPTKNLRATSSIRFPRWTEKAGASWANIQSSWIGYVAVCQDKKEIARLGRRDVVIAFRGTATCLEWMENLRATLTPLDSISDDDDHKQKDDDVPMVESGFLSLYTSSTTNSPSLQDTLRDEIARIIETYKDDDEYELSFTFTGHSLGAALAILAAYDIKKEMGSKVKFTTVVSFGGPRVGNRKFRSLVEKEGGVKILRIVNPDDVITKMPGFVMEDEDEEQLLLGDGGSGMTTTTTTSVGGWSWEWPINWFQKRVEDTKWVYAELGSELRVKNHDYDNYNSNGGGRGGGAASSSSIMNGVVGSYNLDFAKCHDLKTYLHLVAR